MLRLHLYLRLAPLLLAVGCATDAGTAGRIAGDTGAMPPNTVMLSQMMRELSAQPGFTESLLSQLDQGSKKGLPFTPRLVDLFRKTILGKDWTGLDRFPGWTIQQVTHTVSLSEHFIDKRDFHSDDEMIGVQLGPYPLGKAAEVDFDTPSDRGAFSEDGLVTKIGDKVTRGDSGDPALTPLHADSARLAEALNRLSLWSFHPDLRVLGPQATHFAVRIGPMRAETPDQLIALLQHTGHTVTVNDARFFANFGHLHYQGHDVEMPFWLNTGLRVPPDHWWSRRRPYLIPVAHAEYEWMIRGPKVNADVTFYFGIDGRAEFRTNDQLNQPWVMRRNAHQYTGAEAVEVTRLTGALLRAYAYLHLRYPQFPFGGYYTMGVCQDGVAAIEQRMTGSTTLYPNTANAALFRDQPDAEITRMMEAIPRDTTGPPPSPERVFGSLPATDFQTITIPGLREDTQRTYAAWKDGTLDQHRGGVGRIISYAGLLLASVMVLLLMRARRQRA